jgi:hypothetical protein
MLLADRGYQRLPVQPGLNAEGLILRFKPVNMDVLPLYYIVLMGLFAALA